MSRLASIAAGACVLVLVGLAAPALSLSPYRPDPVEFTAAGPSGRAGLSPPIRAPKRFNVVGITWRGSSQPRVLVRARRDGGRWSRWGELATGADDGPDRGSPEAQSGSSTPVWAGAGDWVQLRVSRPLPGVRLRFVNVNGDATAKDRLLGGLRRAVNSGVATLASLIRSPAAGAQAARPSIVPRSSWAGNDCNPRSEPGIGAVKAAVVHHTVSLNDYTRAEAPQIVLGICRFHRDTNGWDDIGYNFLVDRFGTIYEGRAGGMDRAVVGAQSQGYNAQTTGIANLGTYSRTAQSPAALAAMARLIRWKLPLSGAPTSGTTTLVSAGGDTNRYPAGTSVRVPRVAGHRDLDNTECPGDMLYSQLVTLRRMVGSIGPGVTPARVLARVTARRATVDYGMRTSVTGTLTAGSPLTGAAVEVQALIGRSWRRVANPVTGSGGRFSAAITPRANRRLRVLFAGSASVAEASSPAFWVRVRPRLALGRLATAGLAGRRLSVSGRVLPRVGTVVAVLARRSGRRWPVVGRRAMRVSRTGRFAGTLVPLSGGRFRVYVAAPASRSYARGATRLAYLRVGAPRRGGASAG